jgi:hypothetical protein
LSNSASSEEKEDKAGKVPEPKDMVVYDPDHPLYEQRHVCVLLRKVSDALHGYAGKELTGEH